MALRAFLILLCLLSVSARAAVPPSPAVASAHPLATDAGMAILAAGGNAFDAAIAVAAVLAVVEPAGSGMGGGGFWLLHRAADGYQTMVDARETAPAAATATLYQDTDGNVVRDHAINGPLAAAIPGQAAAFDHLAREYGALPLRRSLAPAIDIARKGFPVSERYRTLVGMRAEVLRRDATSAALFLRNGEVPAAGTLIRQPELAATLERLARDGRDGFYRGPVATQLVNGVRAAGGIWTLDDLANYRVIEREPVVVELGDARLVTSPPPSSGGLALAQTLLMLKQFNNGDIDSALRPHLTVEAMRRAYRDRAEFLGDPDYVNIPMAELLSPRHIAQQASSIALDRPTPSLSLGTPLEQPKGTHTTHFSVLDGDGNRVAATLSINLPFGAAFTPAGTGVLLNNEMDDFSAKPGSPNAYGLIGTEANAIAGGKRPLSSMTPTFVEWPDRVALLGTPGGSRIISMVILAVQEARAGKPVEQWVARQRYHHQYLPDQVEVEPAFLGSLEARQLQSRGHELVSTGRAYGDMHVILWDREHGTTAAADPRGEGKAAVDAPLPMEHPAAAYAP